MQGPKGERKFKLIKFFRVKGDRLEERLHAIKQKIRKMVDWSLIEEKKELQQRFMLFPNQSIFNEGIRITSNDKGYTFQMMKKNRPAQTEGSIMYEYQNTFFYNNPIKIFQSIGYQQNVRKHKNVSIFTCLKYGLQIIIYGNDNFLSPSFSFKNTHIEIIESSSIQPIRQDVCFWKIIKNQLGEQLIPILANEINYEMMTIRKSQNIQSMIESMH